MYQQNYNTYYPNMMPQQAVSQRIPMQMILKGKPVASIEEVKATTIDFDGSISYFPDIANNKIYTKQITIDGTPRIIMYEAKEPIVEQQSNDFITRSEFNQTIESIKSYLENADAAVNRTQSPVKKVEKTAPAANF